MEILAAIAPYKLYGLRSKKGSPQPWQQLLASCLCYITEYNDSIKYLHLVQSLTSLQNGDPERTAATNCLCTFVVWLQVTTLELRWPADTHFLG